MTGVPLEIPSYSDTVLQYSEEIKARYNGMMPNQLVSQRDFKFTSKQDSIATVKNRKLIYSTPAFSCLSMNIIQTEPTDIDSISTSSCKCILVECASVSSRTKLVEYLASLWGQREGHFKKYCLLIILDLKKKHVQNINSLWDMFCHPDSSFQHDLLLEVNEAKGKDILIILNGFEHLPTTITKNHHSFYSKLVEGKMLSKSTKLILSTAESVRNIVGSYELVGFLHVELLHTPQPPNRCNSSNMDESINWQDKNGTPIRTQQYIRYCLKLLQDYFTGTQFSTMEDLKAYPQVYKGVLFISRIAFMGLVEKEFVFDNSLVTDPSIHVGLILVSCTHCNNEIVECEFLTPILQEFFAAYFISQQDDREKNEIFFLNSYLEFCGLWKFFAGLCGLTFTMLSTLKCQVYDVHCLAAIVSILYELHDEKAIKFVFEDCSIVNYFHFKSHISDSKSQYFELGYCVAASSCPWSLNFTGANVEYEDLEEFIAGIESCLSNTGTILELQLNFSLMTHDKIQLLSKLNLQNLESLSMASCKMTQKSFDSLASMISCLPKLNSLNISDNCTPSQNLITTLLSNIVSTSFVKILHLKGTTFSCDDIVYLSTAMSMPNSNLVELSVGSKSMTSESSRLLTDSILSHSSIETLSIYDLNLNNDNSTLALIESNTTITRLVFFECKLDISFLATSLCMNTTLKDLQIFFSLNNDKYDIRENDAIALADMLEVNCTLHSLSLYSYKEPAVKIYKLLEILKYNQTLNTLQLPNHFAFHLSEAELGSLDSRIKWIEWPLISFH